MLAQAFVPDIVNGDSLRVQLQVQWGFPVIGYQLEDILNVFEVLKNKV